MRIVRLSFTVLFATFAFGVVVVSSAWAAHPSFLTESGKELLFSGTNPVGSIETFRALNLGVLGSYACEKTSLDGFALPKSPLAHRIKLTFQGKCELTAGGSKAACVEPITWKTSLAELGLVLGNKTVGIYLEPSDGTKAFAEVECPAGSKTTVEGAIIGEIPVISKSGKEQYNKEQTETEAVFEAAGKNSENQNITTIELLGLTKTGELKVTGFFGGKASKEMTLVLTGDGKIEICTRAPSACP
jgi:hypothetical protein